MQPWETLRGQRTAAVFAEEGFDETLRNSPATARRPDHARSGVPAASPGPDPGHGPTSRDTLLDQLAIGLRTYYRELDLLKRCGIKVKRDGKNYHLSSTIPEAEERLPFPDPQLSFAEMAQLAAHPGDASKRLAEILRSVVEAPSPTSKKGPPQEGGILTAPLATPARPVRPPLRPPRPLWRSSRD